MTKWSWKTGLDARGRLTYATPEGKVFLARSLTAEKIAPRVMEEALAAHRPYPPEVRPLSLLGEPGGLIRIETGERTVVVGDLHGRYDNLELILKDKGNLRDVLSGKAHLVFTGDAVHPRSALLNSDKAYEDSLCVMLLIMALKASNPQRVHYLLGNHDAAHAGGMPALRRDVRLDEMFRKVVVRKFGKAVYDGCAEFLHRAPAAAKLSMPNGHILVLHAGQSSRILNEQGLINIFVKGRRSKALQDVLWSRNYDREQLEAFLSRLDARFIISGHTGPTRARAERYGLTIMIEGVAAHAHDRQIIIMAQADTFGYADLDMTRPLPRRVTKLTAQDGRPAVRVFRRTVAGSKSVVEAVTATGPA
jgi:hypothetical protein